MEDPLITVENFFSSGIVGFYIMSFFHCDSFIWFRKYSSKTIYKSDVEIQNKLESQILHIFIH